MGLSVKHVDFSCSGYSLPSLGEVIASGFMLSGIGPAWGIPAVSRLSKNRARVPVFAGFDGVEPTLGRWVPGH